MGGRSLSVPVWRPGNPGRRVPLGALVTGYSHPAMESLPWTAGEIVQMGHELPSAGRPDERGCVAVWVREELLSAAVVGESPGRSACFRPERGMPLQSGQVALGSGIRWRPPPGVGCSTMPITWTGVPTAMVMGLRSVDVQRFFDFPGSIGMMRQCGGYPIHSICVLT